MRPRTQVYLAGGQKGVRVQGLVSGHEDKRVKGYEASCLGARV